MFEANVIQLQPCGPYKHYIVMSNHTYPDIGRSILLMEIRNYGPMHRCHLILVPFLYWGVSEHTKLLSQA